MFSSPQTLKKKTQETATPKFSVTNLATRKVLPDRDPSGKFLPKTVPSGSRPAPRTTSQLCSSIVPRSFPTPPVTPYRRATAQSPSTTAPNSPQLVYIADYMSDSNGLRMFWGDGEVDGENAQDFINGVERSFLAKPNLSEKDKVRTFELWLKSGRAAKTWWNGLAAEEKDSWEHLRAAFEKKWPEKLITEKTMEEQHAALEASVLKEEELGKRVRVDGVEEFSHVVWADKLQRLATALKDDSGLLIPNVRRSMPRALKLLVGTQHRTWSDFCTAVRRVSIMELEEKLELEEEQRGIQEAITRLSQLQQSPTRAIREAMTAASLGPPVPGPRFTMPRTVPSPVITQAPGPVGGMASAPQYRPDADRLADIVRLALPIHPNTAAGRAAYQAQVVEWNSKNAGRPVNETRPFPLSPGTSPVASGECWRCGHEGHMGGACTSTEPVPTMEQKWRSIAATVKRRVETNTVSINLVEEAGPWFDWEAYNAQVIAAYRASQGNGEGSLA
ncbi:hypothetical protein CVT25_006547 [Psilocybe cyanescens]|uniref:CCHC-type domain-containing protein n=1 Tax=Psilocybe cyanescens TaxID=93625 RepID=A0A409W290_PSICY|nr:hypothetical protein CVT25_006547 [Psilocybe cyanescens]